MSDDTKMDKILESIPWRCFHCDFITSESRRKLLRRKASVLNTGAETPWMSCAERLPDTEHEDDFLVRTTLGVTMICGWSGGEWTGDLRGESGDPERVTHWQPLPAPPASVPEGESQGGNGNT
jgi:hypothetical protein